MSESWWQHEGWERENKKKKKDISKPVKTQRYWEYRRLKRNVSQDGRTCLQELGARCRAGVAAGQLSRVSVCSGKRWILGENSFYWAQGKLNLFHLQKPSWAQKWAAALAWGDGAQHQGWDTAWDGQREMQAPSAAALHLQPALLRVGVQLLGCWASNPTPKPLIIPPLLPVQLPDIRKFWFSPGCALPVPLLHP